jgi:Tol biopolymer transport system component
MHPPLAADESGDTQCTWYNKGTGALVATRKVEGPNKRLYRTSFGDDGTIVSKPVTDGTRHVGLPILSPDQKHVAFSQGDDAGDSDSRLFVVDISGEDPTVPTELNGPVVAGGAIPDDSGAITFRWAPDSKHAAYTASAVDAGKRDAFLVDITEPGKATRLNEELPSESSKVASVVFSPDGAWIALLGDLETAGVSEIFLVPLVNGVPGEPQRANDAMVAGEFVRPTLAWSPDGRYLAYVIEDELGVTRARLVELTGGDVGTPVPVGDIGDRVSNLRFLSAGF